ncbi:amidohydrolase family protein [Streptomyces sp. NPDC048251]|uniref:amidohydrolase family protein n=1 Tax=Streptomyces sp. NPDC048251 TaxID=3154501 RepID=UPI0034423132
MTDRAPGATAEIARHRAGSGVPLGAMSRLLIRNAEVNGRQCAVRIRSGRIQDLAPALPRESAEEEIDAAGGALVPGLTDHHLHLFALAASLSSLQCGPPDVRCREDLRSALHRAAPDRHGWIRGVRYHEQVAGHLDATGLDTLRSDVPVRVQHRSGALWVLNSRAAAAVGLADGRDPGIERAPSGQPTGRLWRADAWLRARLPADTPPSLTTVGRRLARYGVTAVTDATPRLSSDSLTCLADAAASGQLPQRLLLLGAPLGTVADARPEPGPWKIVLADSGLPDFDRLTDEISAAHGHGRAVAVHTVTAASLALTLAALERSGSHPGDRLEHAALVPAEALPVLRRLGLRVVTQPGFLADRGDDFLQGTPPAEHPCLYRCGTLIRAGIPLALSSDAPYGPLDPWVVMRAATTRLVPDGRTAGPAERLTSTQALSAYLSPASSPGSPHRPLQPGSTADLVLLAEPLNEALTHPSADLVRLTLIDGVVHHART